MDCTICNFKEAIRWFKEAAERDFVRAQYYLGLMYQHGQGTNQDFSKSFNFYSIAADQGMAEAQHNLALLYKNGQGVEKDVSEFLKWTEKAAQGGNPEAQINMGWISENVGDKLMALAWYSIAASSGHARSSEFRDKLAKKMTSEQIAKAQQMAKEYFVHFEKKRKKE